LPHTLDIQRKHFTKQLDGQPPTLGMKENQDQWDKVDQELKEAWVAAHGGDSSDSSDG
jgi:hypothetical protein